MLLKTGCCNITFIEKALEGYFIMSKFNNYILTLLILSFVSFSNSEKITKELDFNSLAISSNSTKSKKALIAVLISDELAKQEKILKEYYLKKNRANVSIDVRFFNVKYIGEDTRFASANRFIVILNYYTFRDGNFWIADEVEFTIDWVKSSELKAGLKPVVKPGRNTLPIKE